MSTKILLKAVGFVAICFCITIAIFYGELGRANTLGLIREEASPMAIVFVLSVGAFYRLFKHREGKQ